MFGARIGSQPSFVGSAVGSGADDEGNGGVIAGVTRDPTSLKYLPATSAEWTTFLTAIASAISTPDGLWKSQEAATPLVDTIGTANLTAGGTPSYQQTVSGWTTKAVVCADGTAQNFSSVAAALPDISVTSFMVLSFVLFPGAAPAATRGVITLGTVANKSGLNLTTAGNAQTLSTTTNTADGTSHVDSQVHPVVIRVNRTATTVTGFTNISKMVPTFGAAMAGKQLAIGAQPAGLSSLGGGFLYTAAWFGAKAEVSDAEVKKLMQGIGYSIPWS